MNDTVIVTTENILEKVIDRLFDRKISESLPGLIKEATKKPYLTKEEVIELTGWSSRTLQHLRDSNQISYVKHGRKIIYPTEELYDFFEAHHISPGK